MKVQQLRFLVEIVRHNNNISRAAKSLCTSQSGISKQVKLLENELQLSLFERKGRNLECLTPQGVMIYEQAVAVLNRIKFISDIADEYNNENDGFTLATTHTQARYVLPQIIAEFKALHPNVALNIQQGTPGQIAELVVQGRADLAIATESLKNNAQLLALPCYRWGRCVITRKGHALIQCAGLTLQELADYPIITYADGFTGRNEIDKAFYKNNLQPTIVLTAFDADVIKTYVRLGLGVGIIAKMAYNHEADDDLAALDAEHLFGISTTQIAFRKDKYIRNYIYRFIALFAPHLHEQVVKEMMQLDDNRLSEKKISGFKIPVFGAET